MIYDSVAVSRLKACKIWRNLVTKSRRTVISLAEETDMPR